MTARTTPFRHLAALLVLVAACDHKPAQTPSAPQVPTTQPVTTAPLEPQIRVQLAGDLTIMLIEMHDPFDLVAVETGQHLLTVEQPRAVTVAFDRDAILLPGLNRAWELTAIDVVGHGEKPITVEFPDGRRRYPGRMRFVRDENGVGSIVNIVGIESYLVGVVAAELHRGFHPETFCAQAIASRTYARRQMQTKGLTRTYDVTAGESHQVYADLDRAAAVPQAGIAVRDTRGMICVWDTPEGERICSTYFSSTCGGETLTFDPNDRQAAALSLPRTRPCEHCRRSPHYRWGPVTLTKSFITQQLRQRYEKFNEIDPIGRIDVAESTQAGRLVQLVLYDATERGIQLEAENFRLAVDPTGRTLRSTLVTLIDDGRSITFANGRGFGHGIGMCQYGADTLARNEWTAERILSYYYPTSRLTRAY